MPDMSGRCDQVEKLVKRAWASTREKSKRGGSKGKGISKGGRSKGGVIQNRNEKRYTVNIRPSKWSDKNKPSKFWIGKQTREMARYMADAIYHYMGSPRFHFIGENADRLIFPILKCIGTEANTCVRLTTMEIRSKYVQSIAGEDFAYHRKNFIEAVKHEMKSPGFLLQAETYLNSAAALKEDATASKKDATTSEEGAATPQGAVVSAEEGFRNEDDDRAEDTPPIEEDDTSLRAMRLSQLTSATSSSDLRERGYPMRALHVAGSNIGSVCGLEAYTAGFEINPNGSGEKSLQSVGQSFGSTFFSMEDCPTTFKEDKEDYRSWMESIAELNTKHNRNRELSFDSAAYLSWMEDLGSDLDPYLTYNC